MVKGTAEVKLDGTWRRLTAADGGVLVEPFARHALRNPNGSAARLRTWVTPPGRLEEFLTESARAAQRGPLRRPQPPDRRARRRVGERVRAALPRRDRDVLAAAGRAEGRAPGRRSADPALPHARLKPALS